MKIYLSVLFAFFLSYVAMGQNVEIFVIQGQVVEKDTKEPLPYATVALTQLPDMTRIIKGVVTDGTGHFKLTASKGTYNLIIRNIGFRNFVKKLTPDMEDNIDLGVIELQVQPEVLGMVTVKPLVEVTADQITYNLMADPDREKSSLHAILDKVPLIERNIKGDLYIEDEGKKFLVVRNGKTDALFDGNINDLLKSIPAKGFATVTVMLAPPEHYGDYDYVVNITTDKTARLYGAVGMIKGIGDVNNGLFDSESGIISSLNKVRLNVGVELDSKNAPERINSIIREQKKDGSLLVQEEEINTSGEKWAIGGMVSQDISKEHFINWRIGYGKQSDRDKRHTESQWDEQPKEITDFIKRASMRPLYGAIEYQYDIGKTQKVLNIAYQLRLQPKEKEDFGSGNGLSMTERMQEQTLQVHYYNPFKKGFRLETGASYIYRDNSQKVGSKGIVSNSLEERKHIINAYGRLNYSHKRFSAFLALKADYLNDGDGILQITDGKEERISVTGLHWMPEANVSWLLSKKNFSRLSLSYTLTHLRPSLKMLSVYEDLSTPGMVIKGNPELKEEDYHALNLSLNIAKWTISCLWNHSGNKIGSYWYQDEQQRIIQTYANQNISNYYGLNVFRSFRYKQWMFSGRAGSNYNNERMAGDERSEKWNVFVDFGVSHAFKQAWNIGLNARYYDMFSSGYSSYDRSPYTLSCYVKKQFMKERGELEISYGDLLRFKQDLKSQIDTDIFKMTTQSDGIYIPLNITLKFRIGSYKIRPVRQIRKGIVIEDLSTE